MFNKLKNLFGSQEPAAPASLAEARLGAMVDALEEPDHVDRDTDADHKIDIYAFGRNFVEECDDDAEDDEGYVLITSGMSDRLMTAPDGAEMEETLATELVWYVRDLNPEYVHMLRWLAKLPAIDATWFGSGHRVPMPTPPLSFCGFRTFLLLEPIIATDRDLFDGLTQQDQPLGTLAVHLVSDAEYALIKRDEEGLNAFLDLLDENGYPLVFDPDRQSYVD
jgi:Suppressor of fused protein (SUFU)